MLVDDLISDHMGEGSARPRDFVTVKVDRIYIQDGNSPTLARLFKKHDIQRVFDPSRVGVFSIIRSYGLMRKLQRGSERLKNSAEF
ncbi:hypothetical protein DC522_32980 [Microvirga sp. KLBC 81]|nr:hypothetical protein DC522_32980 [Microvirga sp. KLBC 81]